MLSGLFNDDDDSLIRKALSGSQRAWVRLVARHERQVYNYCLRQTRHRTDAHDLLQDVFLAVYRHLPSYRGDGAFIGWVMRIAVNKTMDWHRLRQRTPQGELDEQTELQLQEWQAAASSEPAYAHERLHDNRSIHAALQTLPLEQRLVVELKFFQHFTFEQISQQTGVPVNTVKTRLYSGLNKLKVQMEAQHAM